ncbi:MLP-like protein 34 [Chenopodium quinoa]|uniref:MLP-like protein 34 n=1 Tax=Chenopodium quinoa TaxID=63459 RepID=UPI000B772FFC|nr:MLP-like protein 34 [Chenopodium quinoa]
MSLKRKFEGEVEVREGAGDAFHDMYKSRPHHIKHAASNFVQSCDLHHGQDFGVPGSILSWNFTLDGKSSRSAKTEIEEIDEQKRLVRQKITEGDILDGQYKSMICTCHVEPKDKETCIVKWVIEYEKVHPNIPEPTSLMDALLNAAKDIDDHHHGIKK